MRHGRLGRAHRAASGPHDRGAELAALLPASVLLGGAYLLLVDDLARMVAAVEMPLGILTALIGVPFFLFLLKYNTRDWQ